MKIPFMLADLFYKKIEHLVKGRGGETVTMTAWDCFHKHRSIINLCYIIKDVTKTAPAHNFFFFFLKEDKSVTN